MDTNKRIARAMLKKSFAEAKELVFKSLYAKASLALDEARYAVANAIFNEAELDEMAMTKARENQLGRKMVTQSTAQMRSYGTSKHPSEYRKSRELQKQYGKEDKSKKTYGINGKVVKEESELDEMAQTAQRSKEMNKKVDAAYIKHDRALQKGFAAGHSEGSKQIRKIDSDYQKVSNQNRREKSSKKLYGKGGKEIDAKRYKGKTVGAEGNLRKPKGNTETKLRDALQAERLRSLGVRSND
jgi:hypothetical protein